MDDDMTRAAAPPPPAAPVSAELPADVRVLVLETANQVALNILASRTGMDALQHIAEAARALAGARYSALGVARLDGGGGLQEFITAGLTPEQEERIGPRPCGKGVLGLLLRRTEPLRLDALSEHAAFAGFPPNHPPMKTFLGVPIRREDTTLGSLYLTEKENGGPFTPADELAVQALGAHAAVAIHHLQMLHRQRTLLAGLINAQEEERRAVAYELHDGLTQYVMAGHAHLEACRRAQQAGDAERAAREFEQSRTYIKEAVVESRRLVNGLRALALDDLGLAGALEQLLSEEKARANWIAADLVHNVAGRRFDKVLETAAFRVGQEALTNARKHARTERFRLALLAGSDTATGAATLTLEARDWGQGFVPGDVVGGERGFGLHSMAERVSLLGGSYQLHSAPGEGTVVRAVFPLLEPQAGEGGGY
jgi:signal transduction histidine kinase